MGNNKSLGLVVRMVNYKGNVKFCYCEEDEDGYVERVYLQDEPELIGKDVQELKEVVAGIVGAMGKSAIVVNSGNKKSLVCVDLEG